MTKGESKLIIEVADIEWDAPKSVKNDLPQSFVFHLDTEDEGIDCSDEEEIHECVSTNYQTKLVIVISGLASNRFNNNNV